MDLETAKGYLSRQQSFDQEVRSTNPNTDLGDKSPEEAFRTLGGRILLFRTGDVDVHHHSVGIGFGEKPRNLELVLTAFFDPSLGKGDIESVIGIRAEWVYHKENMPFGSEEAILGVESVHASELETNPDVLRRLGLIEESVVAGEEIAYRTGAIIGD